MCARTAAANELTVIVWNPIASDVPSQLIRIPVNGTAWTVYDANNATVPAQASTAARLSPHARTHPRASVHRRKRTCMSMHRHLHTPCRHGDGLVCSVLPLSDATYVESGRRQVIALDDRTLSIPPLYINYFGVDNASIPALISQYSNTATHVLVFEASPPPVGYTLFHAVKTAATAETEYITSATSVAQVGSPLPAPGLGSLLPHRHRDWPRSCHICTGTGLTAATSAPGLRRSSNPTASPTT